MKPSSERLNRGLNLRHGPATHSLMFVLALGLGVAGGCKSEPGPEPLTAATKPALSTVSAERTDLMYRFRDGEGVWQQAVSLAEVPETAREAVQVIDLSLSPAERNAGHYVQIFDLRTANAEGVFPGRLVPRAELEQVLAAAAVKPTFAPITMYSASWCGYCKKARAFLTDQGIPFEEKDVETTPGASAELAASAAKAGVQTGGGVPVFVVGDRVLQGFDPDALLKAAKGG